MASDQVEENVKEHLRETFAQMNPAELKRKIMRLQMALSKASAEKDKDVSIRNVTVSSAATFL
ncbi:MAG: hypothetical protein AB1576_06650 [Bacillota bacterium]